MEAYVDQDTCIGCELCTTMVPDVFRMNDEGKSEAYGETTEENTESVEAAIEACPVNAIGSR